jgi:hypothetical protein
MRSAFLGECARLPGLTRVVNDAQYLLPPMRPEALMRAIQRPAELYDGEVTVELTNHLTRDVYGETDELPLIQHGLMSRRACSNGFQCAGGRPGQTAE